MTTDVTLRAQQLAVVFERFVEAGGARRAVLARIFFITIALAVALPRAIALAASVAGAVGAGLAVFAVGVGRAANLQRVDAEPVEEV